MSKPSEFRAWLVEYHVISCDATLMYITGVGSQFLVLAFGIIVMAMLGLFNVHR